MERKVTNTTREIIDNPAYAMITMLGGSDAILNMERQGQRELQNANQLPRIIRNEDAKSEYEKHGIKVIGETKNDNLFYDVILPEGWKVRSTGHSMWNELVDENERVRATFFYKAAFYDRDAFLNFCSRYSYNTITYLPQEEKGHYDTIIVKRKIDPCGSRNWDRMNEYGEYMIRYETRYEEKEEKVWVPKYKNDYAEYNATPMYFEIKDGDKVIYTTKDAPVYFKRRYRKDQHRSWWNAHDAMQEQLRTDAKAYLDENYPEWQDTTKYF